MKIKTKVDTWLPVFSGFYNTIWESDRDEEMEIEHINERRKEKGLSPIEWDAVKWDYEKYKEDVVKGVTDKVCLELASQGFIESYELQKLVSPREYNFTNDSINVAMVLNDENKKAIAAYLKENKEAFDKYIKRRYTSYDGLFSRYSNDTNEWLSDLDAALSHAHKLGSILDFILLNEDADLEMSIYEDLSGNGVCLTAKNYTELTKGG